MPIAMHHAPQGLTAARYDEVIRRVEAAGQDVPLSRIAHCAYLAGADEIHVFDLWESREAFEAFGETLVPILLELGIDPGAPQISEVHNLKT